MAEPVRVLMSYDHQDAGFAQRPAAGPRRAGAPVWVGGKFTDRGDTGRGGKER